MSNGTSFFTTVDRVFLYIGVLALVALAFIVYVRPPGAAPFPQGGRGAASPPPAEIVIGRLDTGQCFVYPEVTPNLGRTPNSPDPNKVYWRSLAPAGAGDSFTITFTGNWPFNGSKTNISVPATNGTLNMYTVDPNGPMDTTYDYSIADNTTPCTAVPVQTEMRVHVTQ